MKYGFILNSEGCRPDNYSGSFGTPDFQAYVVGAENQDMARTAARDLVEQGVEALDLCGDYVDERRDDIREAIGHKINVRAARFFPEQAEKLDKINWDSFGFIVMHPELNPDRDIIKLRVPACALTMVGVSNMSEACKAVQDMIAEGIEFMELCRYFDEGQTREVIRAADATGKLYALGSVGIEAQE